MRMEINIFGGMRPALQKHLLQEGEARQALNADLSSGALVPLPGPILAHSGAEPILSMWLHNGVWRTFADRRRFAEAPVTDDAWSRFYMSRENGGLRFMDKDGAEYDLGCAAPAASPAPDKNSVAQRGGNVTFEAAANGFYFNAATGSVDCPYLTPGLKVSFSGAGLPPGITAGKQYVIIMSAQRECSPPAYWLGDPASSNPNAPIAAGNGAGYCAVLYAGSRQTRVYAFTAVNIFGEESAPSPPSPPVDVDISCNITVGNLVCGDAPGRAPIAHKRIYRAATGTEGTAYLFVAEIAAETESFVDNRLDSELAEPLPALDWKEPPLLRNLVELPGGMLAAHDDTQVCISEPYMPSAWPLAQRYSVPGGIVAIAASQNTVFALTGSRVHAITADEPAAARVTALDGFVPCLSAAGVATSPMGVLFPSNDGLYLIAAGMSAPECVTDGLINEDAWRELNPASFIGAFFDTFYIAFLNTAQNEKSALLLDFGKANQARMRVMDTWGDALQLIPRGRNIYYSRKFGNEWYIYKLFADVRNRRPATWRSKEYRFPYPVNMAALIVETEEDPEVIAQESRPPIFWGGPIGGQMCGETPFGGEQTDKYVGPGGSRAYVLLYGDGRERFRSEATGGRIRLLPSGYAARFWEVEISSRVTVKRVAVATSAGELMQ